MTLLARPASPTVMLFPRLISALAVLILYSASPGDALAQNGREQRWAIQPTDHFDIHYQSQQRSHVDAVAREAERAYARISYALRHELTAKMPLILVGEDRDLPRNEGQARALVTASRASNTITCSCQRRPLRSALVVCWHTSSPPVLVRASPPGGSRCPLGVRSVGGPSRRFVGLLELVKVRDAMVQAAFLQSKT